MSYALQLKLDELRNDIRKLESRNHELDTLRSNVASLEHTNRELSSTVDGLRHELQELRQRIGIVEEALEGENHG